MAIGFELSTDEAHYALYGYFPALSYFDHPPLVGWSQIPIFALFQNPPDWVLRLVPMLSHAATLLLLTQFSLRNFGESAARWTAIIIAVAPLPHMLGAAQVPDSLLIFWAALLLVLTQQLTQVPKRLGLWFWLGITLGLAGLSKYTAAFFVPSMIAYLLYHHGVRLLLTRGPWIAMLIAGCLISPVIIWNAQHDWVSFVYQGAHGTGDKAWEIAKSAQQFIIQIVVYGPLLTLLPLGLIKLADRNNKETNNRHALALILAVPFIVIMLFLAGRSNALPHWTAPAWLLLAPSAGWVASQLQKSWGTWWGSRLASGLACGLAYIQAVLCVGLVGWMLSGGTPDPHGLNNPPADLYGWKAAGETAQRLAHENNLNHLVVQNWSIASRLAWYARPLPVNVLDDRFDQFDLWYGDLPVGADAVLVDWSPLPFYLPVGEGQFQQCAPLAEQAVQHWGKTLSYFQFFRCTHWGGHPAPREKNAA